ncbi:hypothetical protein MCEMSEM23_01122 [Rhabdaerophilaceae bacterium]
MQRKVTLPLSPIRIWQRLPNGVASKKLGAVQVCPLDLAVILSNRGNKLFDQIIWSSHDVMRLWEPCLTDIFDELLEAGNTLALHILLHFPKLAILLGRCCQTNQNSLGICPNPSLLRPRKVDAKR